jgi:hypothetical protein
MADKVGTKTNKKTQAGRDVYETPEGEMVSEKSTTFKYKGQWINIPSIHEGHRYDDDTLILMLEAGLIKPTSVHKSKEEAEQAARKRSDSLKFNQGGTPMLEQQMELFEDGGLRDEGGEVDEVSGNEVPIGGTKKGVRDDVPAMVSEGEFVFPEDVTRYIGLDKLMQMRQEAKMGLKRMDAMGQMGNGDEATMPDDMPFSMADLIVVAGDTGEELEMADGGFVRRSTTARRTEQQPTYAQPTDQDAQQPVFKTTRRLLPEREAPEPINLDFSGIMGESKISFKEYRNEEGKSVLMPFIGGSPVFPIPDGYTLYTAEDSSANTNEVASKVNEIAQAQEKDTYEVPDFLKPQPPEPKNWAAMPTDELIDELGSVTGTSRLITKGAMMLMGPVGLAGNLMMRHQDKNIVAAIDAALARGGLSAEYKTTLTAAKEELTKSGMLGFLDPIIDGIANVLGVPEEQVIASVNANVQSGAVEVSPRPRARPIAEEPEIDSAISPQLISGPKQSELDGGKATIPTEAAMDASNYLTQKLASSQGGDSFTGGDYDVASNDPNFVRNKPEPDSDRSDIAIVRDTILKLSKPVDDPFKELSNGIALANFKKRATKAFGADTVREAESGILPIDFYDHNTGEVSDPVEVTRDLSGIPTAMDKRAAIAARPMPQIEITQQPVESIVNAPPRKTDVVTTDMQLAPVPPSFSAVPEYMDTDTGTPSYGPVPADPRISRRFTGADPFERQDTANTLAAFGRGTAPEAYVAGNRAGVSTQQPPSLQEQALRLLDEDAQTRLANVATSGNVTEIVENANKVMSDINRRRAEDASNVPEPQTDASALQTGPAIAEATFGAPLGDPLGGTPPPVDELVFTPTQQQQPTRIEDVEAQYSVSPELKSETFSEAFARNRKKGKKPFTYKGKKYTTETKEEKAAKEKAAKPKRDTGSKSNRLDQSNPNSGINFDANLAEWEKDMARSNPALAQHFIATANRRQNDIEKTGKDPEDKISAKKTDESGGLGGWIKKQFGKKKGGLATRY